MEEADLVEVFEDFNEDSKEIFQIFFLHFSEEGLVGDLENEPISERTSRYAFGFLSKMQSVGPVVS